MINTQSLRRLEALQTSTNSQLHISCLPPDFRCRHTVYTHMCVSMALTDVRTCAAALANTKQMASPHSYLATKISKQPM